MTERMQILVAEDEANLRRVISAMLTRDGYEVHTASDGEQAIGVLKEHHIDTVITDLRMPKVDGMALLRHVCKEYDNLPVIMITAHGTVDTAVEALKIGAFDYITKPFEREEFRAVVGKALKTHDLGGAEVHLKGPEPGRYRIIGQSPSMMEVYSILEKVADTPSTVLLTGESGTGKELIATALHEHSSRRDKPFIRVNCAAIPKDLIESELFGYEKGAFTGAVSSKPGRFELAHAGTLFLDEIGEIPVEMQVKLLRALQESEFERVGGIKTIKVDVRLITATNRDLRQGIGEGSFREDLYYRLNVVNIHLPPLRERTGDISLLVEHFVRRFNAKLGKTIEGVSPEARGHFVAYGWPGNIRELENVLERCVLLCDGSMISESDLPPDVRLGRATPSGADRAASDALDASRDIEEPTSLKQKVREAAERVERELIVRALHQTGNNVTHAARLLKISRKSLQMKMKDLGLREER